MVGARRWEVEAGSVLCGARGAEVALVLGARVLGARVLGRGPLADCEQCHFVPSDCHCVPSHPAALLWAQCRGARGHPWGVAGPPATTSAAREVGSWVSRKSDFAFCSFSGNPGEDESVSGGSEVGTRQCVSVPLNRLATC